MGELQRINADPEWGKCIVAAPGPSLTEAVARQCRIKRLTDYWKIIAVQDAYKLLPHADALYGCDNHWWEYHQDCHGFQNEKWASHNGEQHSADDKLSNGLADRLGLRLVQGKGESSFSLDPGVIHYGSHSGFQAVNLAILKGCKRIVLVGYDLHYAGGKAHFFGDHPKELRQSGDAAMRGFATHYETAKNLMPKDISIVNATPGSALTCFPMATLEEALSERYAAAV